MVMFAGIPLGFVREGISLWGPTLLYESFRLDLQSTMGAALLIPIFNFFGVISARLLITKFIRKETKLVAVFFAGGVISCIFLYLFKGTNIIIYLGLLAICSLCLYGASSIVTSVIPLKYYMPSSAAGFLDFSIYLGAGLSGIITGFVTQKFGWSIVVFIWIVIGMIGSICAYKSED